MNEWFPVTVGLRQCCMKSPWLFNVYSDGVVPEVNVRLRVKGKLCRLVSEFGRACERRNLRVNVGNSKVMRCSRYGNGGRMHVIQNGEQLEEVDFFKNLGSQILAEGYRAGEC